MIDEKMRDEKSDDDFKALTERLEAKK